MESTNKLIKFTTVVPDLVKKKDTDVLVLQAGNIELTNIDVVKAVADKEQSGMLKKVVEKKKFLKKLYSNSKKDDYV